MAKAQARVKKVTLIDEGIIELLQSEAIEDALMEVGEEIARDANTLAGGDEKIFEAEIYRKRKTRSVVNVVNTSPEASKLEALYGWLARASAKQRMKREQFANQVEALARAAEKKRD